MNVPLTWLAEYVALPKSEKELTDRLTMIGHMLDKQKVTGDSVVIDLELRGNRADMFGLIGVARDISAVFHTPLKLPTIAKLPKTDKKMPLIHAEKSAEHLVKRYIAVKLAVKVAPSPKWLADRLAAYGIDPINNVVDVTNYVMVETSHPMHAFDADKLSGDSLHLRLAKQNESFETIQQGTTVKLTTEDIAICDNKGVQCLTCIGGAQTKVTDKTITIILETAVYDAANCRRTARRHKISTEGGGRHEKHQDPHELPFALARAVKILNDIADAEAIGGVSDYFPHPTNKTSILFSPQTVNRLVGMTIPTRDMVSILESLAFQVVTQSGRLKVTVPTFRTDVQQEADIVEEIVRIHGYESIPTETLSGALPTVGTLPHILFANKIRIALQNLQLNEVITSTLIENDVIPVYEKNGSHLPVVTLVNAPDSDIATLRPSMIPNLVMYAKRSLGFRQKRIAFFELGNIYMQPKPKKYEERMTLGIVLGGTTPSSWNKQSRTLSFFDLKGVIEGLSETLDIQFRMESGALHPSLETPAITIYSDSEVIGYIGAVHKQILQYVGINEELYCAQLDISLMSQIQTTPKQPYVIAPLYPPIVEDMSFTVGDNFQIGPFIDAIKKASTIMQSVTLLDTFENKRMVRIVYADPTRTLSSADTKPVREKLISLAKNSFSAELKNI